eukprot:2045579-Rhodomonas_salina.1
MSWHAVQARAGLVHWVPVAQRRNRDQDRAHAVERLDRRLCRSEQQGLDHNPRQGVLAGSQRLEGLPWSDSLLVRRAMSGSDQANVGPGNRRGGAVHSFLKHPRAKRAGLTLVEVIALRLYTGATSPLSLHSPMYVKYNAVLRNIGVAKANHYVRPVPALCPTAVLFVTLRSPAGRSRPSTRSCRASSSSRRSGCSLRAA